MILKLIVRSGVVLAVLTLLLWGFVRLYQARGVYFPSSEITGTPSDVQLKFKEINFNSLDGISLSGWYIPRPESSKVLLYLHGNAGNIGHRLEKLKILSELDLNIFIFDYRGYGKSGGSPTEEGLYRDARAAYSYLKEELEYRPENIVIYGKSLGGNVAIDLGGRVGEGILISESAFTGAVDMGKLILPFVPRSVLDLFVTLDYNSLEKIKEVEIPKLIIHARDDRITPYFMGEQLFEAAAEPKEFYSMQGGHNQIAYRELMKWQTRIDKFIKNNTE
ncbi:MAG: alpha/beta hydrolase [Elusimicrobiota bacterium]